MLSPKKTLENVTRSMNPNLNRHEYLCLDMNESVGALPEKFIKSILHEVTGRFIASYPSYDELEEKIAAVNGVQAKNVFLSNGSDAAIKAIFETFVCMNDKVVLMDPCFAMFPIYANIAGAKLIKIGFKDIATFDCERFKKALTKDVKLAVIVNPNNPTGSFISRKELISIIQHAHKQEVLILVDEAYFYYYPHSVIDLTKKFPNLIVTRTFSKLCALAAVRIGYAVASEGIVNNLKKIRSTYDISGLAVKFALNLLKRPKLIDKMINEFRVGKKFIVEALRSNGFGVVECNASFILINVGKNAKYFMDHLKLQKVLVGGGFSKDYLKEYIRVTVGPTVQMKRFLKKFLVVAKSLKYDKDRLYE